MRDHPDVRWGSAVRPFPGEHIAGDIVECWQENETVWACAVDGLGHGPQAYEAAHQLVSIVRASMAQEPLQRLIEADHGLRSTRGAAAALACAHEADMRVTIAAVGNISGMIFGRVDQHFSGVPGIVGAHVRSPRQLEFDFSSHDLLLMWTDGLNEVAPRPAFVRYRDDPARMAEALLATFGNDHDDCGVLCLRLASGN